MLTGQYKSDICSRRCQGCTKHELVTDYQRPRKCESRVIAYYQRAGPILIFISIIAVHGMNVFSSDGHSENTWTEEESRTHWLRDLLPEILPRARILAYKYNANVVFRTSAAGVEEQARNLLHCLHSERRVSQGNRYFVAKSKLI